MAKGASTLQHSKNGQQPQTHAVRAVLLANGSSKSPRVPTSVFGPVFCASKEFVLDFGDVPEWGAFIGFIAHNF